MDSRAYLAAAATAGAMLLVAPPAEAQTLSDGDYAQCEVYRNGEYRGLSQSCLERKRAQIRRYQRDSNRSPVVSNVYRCPYWANGGYGYLATWRSDDVTSYSGTFDSTLNGRPCIANPVYITRGVR
ncbi:hypothetical protein [Sphingosinithalassobacter portus]|uniref:hypothetical protein n=1 Tax=Stakelama portus TaxID=2676234 RepID=UPI000D6DCFE1|nr:hypothetical protein [Sphingosinithalassobacter portus]